MCGESLLKNHNTICALFQSSSYQTKNSFSKSAVFYRVNRIERTYISFPKQVLNRQLMKIGNVNITPVPLSICDSHCYADDYELHILISCEACRYSSYLIDLKSQIVVFFFSFINLLVVWVVGVLCLFVWLFFGGFFFWLVGF